MSSFVWREKLEALNKRRRVWAAQSTKEDELNYSHPIARYDESFGIPNKSFYDYLLPNEIHLLRTMNMESFERNEPHCKVFKVPGDLNLCFDDRNSSTSNDEDGPPASEELFMDDDQLETFNRHRAYGAACKPLTVLQKGLLRQLANIFVEPDDAAAIKMNKVQRRLLLIGMYCKDMKRKRYARAYKRFTKTRARNLDLIGEASVLQSREIEDKNLYRKYYYGPGEPIELTALLETRRNAIRKKCEIYQSDVEYRQMHINRTYFNVYKKVPESDQHEHSDQQKHNTSEKQKHATFEELRNENANQNASLATRGTNLIDEMIASKDNVLIENSMNEAMISFNKFFNSSENVNNTSPVEESPVRDPNQHQSTVERTLHESSTDNNQIASATNASPITSLNKNDLNEKLNTAMASLKDYCETSYQNASVNDKVNSAIATLKRFNEPASSNADGKLELENKTIRPRKKQSKTYRRKTDKKINRETVYMESRNAWTPTQSPNQDAHSEPGPVYLEQRRKRVQRTVGPKKNLPKQKPIIEKCFDNYMQNDGNGNVGNEIGANEKFDDPQWDEDFDKKMFDIFRSEAFEHYQHESGYAIASRLFEMKYSRKD